MTHSEVLTNIRKSDLDFSYPVKYKNHVLKNVCLYRHNVNVIENFDATTIRLTVFNSYSNSTLNELKVCNECDIIMNSVVEYNKDTIELSQKLFYNGLLLPDCNIQLYNYQIRDIQWMKEIEQGYLKWGCYINEVGLGKTLVLLTFIKSTFDEEKRQLFKTDSNVCNYKYTRITNSGTFCKKPLNKDNKSTSLYCDKHKKTSSEWSRIIESHPSEICLTRSSSIEYIQELKSNATLVFCPTHITHQWLSEIEKYFGKSMRVILMVNKSCIVNTTLSEILGADVIIMSHNMMSCFQELDDTRLLDTSSILVRDIIFKRVIYDESHELFTKNRVYNTFKVKSNSVWCVSGTPFSKYSTNYYNNVMFSNQYKYLDTRHTNENEDYKFLRARDIPNIDIFSNIQLDYNKIRHHYRRNIKENVKHEMDNFKIIDNTIWLDFTQMERDVYESFKYSLLPGQQNMIKKELLKLCCDSELLTIGNLDIKNCTTLEQVSMVILDGNEKKLLTTYAKMIDYKCIKDSIQNDFNNYTIEVGLVIAKQVYDNDITVSKRNYTESENSYNSQKKLVEYLRLCINKLKVNNTQDVECAICLDEYSNHVIILGCGHIYCKECIETFCNTLNFDTCPTCKSKIVTKVTYNRQPKPITQLPNDYFLSQLINKYKSTKIANIIVYIQDIILTGNKCVIFSQWDILLHKIGDILKKENINIEYCQGSVYQKKNSITRFQKDPSVPVILLSSKNAASGLNLVEANIVILIEPLYGDAMYKENIENQAIGRVSRIGQKKDVTITRFLIKDTVEEEIHKGNIVLKDIPM
jgi:SNF2 family DNA or RNA helicase